MQRAIVETPHGPLEIRVTVVEGKPVIDAEWVAMSQPSPHEIVTGFKVLGPVHPAKERPPFGVMDYWAMLDRTVPPSPKQTFAFTGSMRIDGRVHALPLEPAEEDTDARTSDACHAG